MDGTRLATAHAEALALLDERLRWLSAWTIHHANHLRDHRDGLKVGGHQASYASMSTIMAALYFHALRPQDRVAVKPHGGPLLHAAHYLAGNQSLDQLRRFRAYRGAAIGIQSNPPAAAAAHSWMAPAWSFAPPTWTRTSGLPTTC